MNLTTYNSILNNLIKDNPTYTPDEIKLTLTQAINELTTTRMISRFDSIIV